MKTTLTSLIVLLAPLAAQEIKFPPELERLASKAVETTNVTLDSSMLKSLLKSPAKEKTTGVDISELKGVYVRSFKFAKEGEYSSADVESIRTAIRGPGWTSILSTRGKGSESADIAVKRAGDRVVGLVILAAEPKELTFVNIDGPFLLDQLEKLGGQLGIPTISPNKPETKK